MLMVNVDNEDASLDDDAMMCMHIIDEIVTVVVMVIDSDGK